MTYSRLNRSLFIVILLLISSKLNANSNGVESSFNIEAKAALSLDIREIKDITLKKVELSDSKSTLKSAQVSLIKRDVPSHGSSFSNYYLTLEDPFEAETVEERSSDPYATIPVKIFDLGGGPLNTRLISSLIQEDQKTHEKTLVSLIEINSINTNEIARLKIKINKDGSLDRTLRFEKLRN